MDDLNSLSFEQKKQALLLLKEKQKRASRRKIYSYFPDEGPLRRDLYKKHIEFFSAGSKYRERAMMAANRVGKTECTCYEASVHMLGEYPLWWTGKRYTKPVKAWFAGTTAETTRDILQMKLLGPLSDIGTGLIPYDKLDGEPKRDSGIPEAVETFKVKHRNGGVSRGQFKAYRQGRKSFEGDEVDVVVLDEEPPLEIYTECLLRTMTTQGLVLLGFTPLDGLSETVLAFMPGGQVPKEGAAGKFLVSATWDDAPHLTEKDKEEILSGIPLYQRGARSKGIPQLGSGAIYPVAEEDVLVPDFILPEYFPQAYALDVGWNCTAALWGAWDKENDIIFLHRAYKRGQAEPASHAMAIKAGGEWIDGVCDPAASGSSQKDGTKLIEEYNDLLLGLRLSPADNSVEAGLFATYKRMTTGRLKVFQSLVGWLEEFRIYRRDAKGKVVKENDHLMDCTRYLVMSGADVAKTKPQHDYRKRSVTYIMDQMAGG